MSRRGRVYPPLSIRFQEGVDKRPGHGPRGTCWIWTKHKSKSGYGQIGRSKDEGGRVDYAHRISFELHHKVDLGRARRGGLLVLHTCDNRACVNPDHLFLGDDQTNVQDMVRKGRKVNADQAGEANPAHKLSDDDIRAIRAATGTYADIGEAFGISQSWAWNIRNHKAWSHLD